MARYYKKITEQEFSLQLNKMFKYFEDNDNFPDIIEKDLSKVQFDRENISRTDEIVNPKYPDEAFGNYLAGHKLIGDDLHIYFMSAGGDWEYPISFVFYWDGSKIRAYIPEKGNVYHKEQKVAYGSHVTGKSYGDIDDEELDKLVDNDKIIEDILSRIKLK